MAVGNSPKVRRRLKNMQLDEHINVSDKCNLAGMLITARAAPRRFMQNQMVMSAVRVARATAKS